LSIKKSDLKDVAKVMFQVGEWSWEVIKWFLGVLKTTLLMWMKRCLKVTRFHVAEVQDAENDLNGISIPWNIASSTSPNSHLKTSRRQTISSLGHSEVMF
jgi:hypothetical protein